MTKKQKELCEGIICLDNILDVYKKLKLPKEEIKLILERKRKLEKELNSLKKKGDENNG